MADLEKGCTGQQLREAVNGKLDATEGDKKYVSKSGDTMTGDLSIEKPTGIQYKMKSSNGAEGAIEFRNDNALYLRSRCVAGDNSNQSYIAICNENAGMFDFAPLYVTVKDNVYTMKRMYHEGFAPVISGSYTGDGTEVRFIDLGFTPSAVLVQNQKNEDDEPNGSDRGLATINYEALSAGRKTTVKITTGGFYVYYNPNAKVISDYQKTNLANTIFNYIAVRNGFTV